MPDLPTSLESRVDAPAASAPRTTVCLVLREGDRERVFTVEPGRTTSIGRSPDRHVHVPDSRVSGAHCEVFERAGRFFVLDLASTNGTLVNGMLVTERELVAGDRIELAGAIAIDVLARPPAGLAPEIELPRGIVRARGGDIPPTERVPREPLDALIDLEARLRDTEHRLGARIEAVERLAADRLALLAMAAHDVRTPLTVIVGYVAAIGDRLALEGGPAWLGEDLEAVGHAASGAADLLRDLLDRQRAELGKLELRPERGDLAALLAELAASYRRWAAIAGRRVALELLAPLPLVRFDRQRVVQIMNNLVHNGIKHAARGALVTIVARPAPPDAVEVAVENEGKGFDPSDTDRMLALFERGTSREPPIGEGHGVGLAIVKQLVELHGGRLTLSSLGGRGARFAFTLLVDGPRR